MEDILASIRRIIADDQSRGQAAAGTLSRRAAAAGPFGGRVERSIPPLRREADPPPPEAAPPRAVTGPAAETAGAAVPHLNPPPPPPAAEAPGAAIADEHLAVFSEIAKAGVASILAPPAADLPSASVPAPVPLPVALPPAPAVEADHDPFAMEPAAAEPEESEVFGLAGYEAAPDEEPAEEPPAEPDAAMPLLSDAVGASVESSFQALANSVFLRHTGAVDSMVRDMLRPLLKTWLDDNLPTIVERLVRAEIERVARGGRG